MKATGLLLLLPLLLPLAIAAPACPKCGNLTVPYPLSTSSSCGDQLYKVACNASQGKLSLNTDSGAYPILSITPSTQRLVIGSPPFSPADTCASSDISRGGLVLNASLPFNVTSSNTIFLLNCSQTLLFSPLNCTSQSLCTEYIAQDTAAKACEKKLCCSFTAGGSSTSHNLRVDYADCTAYVSVVGINTNSPVKDWNYGIELEWISPLQPVCSSQADCSSLSTCTKDPSSNSLRCMCNAGYQWDGITGACTVTCSNGSNCGKKRRLAPLVAGVIVGALGCCAIALLLMSLRMRRKAVKEARAKLSKERQLILSSGGGGRSAKLYTSQDMKKATHGFAKDRLLGSGGFGDVYKGILEDGTVVAVKVAKVGNTKGIEQVLNEVRILSQVNHKGLVMLLGCCVETEQPLLVYEHVPNGTLLEHLKGGRHAFLDWRTRLKVGAQTAEGLAYLHSSANPPIYHRDVKSSNILLDAELNAKVSDFGLSRLAETDLSHISTCAQGTLGYLDPEYYRNYQLTAKSDVYSFGVVLLELVTSQRVIEFARGQDDVNLAIYVAGKAEQGRVMDVVDPFFLKKMSIPPAMVGGVGAVSASSLGSSSGSATDMSFASNLSFSSPAPLLKNTVFSTQGYQKAEHGGAGGIVGEAAVAESICKVVCLALSCLQDNRMHRPSMKEVADELQSLLQALDAALGYGGNVHKSSKGFGTVLSGVSAAPLLGDDDNSPESSTIATSLHHIPAPGIPR